MKPLDTFYDNLVVAGKGTPRFFYKFFMGLVAIILAPLFRFKAARAAAVRARKQGYILAGNHNSYIDPVFVMLALKPRAVRFIGKEEFFRIPVVRRGAAWVGAFPVKRASADMKVVKRSAAMLKRGELVGIFPEGTRGRDGAERELHDGIALIAHLAKADVIPFRLFNTDKICPPGTKLWRFPAVSINFGEPVSLNNPAYEGLDKKQKFERFTQDVMEAVYALPNPREQ
jgi:1-acyl-sn-glycerol-3-phosphate acyltransferase